MALNITNGKITLAAATNNIVSVEKGFGSQRAILVLTNTEAAGGNTIAVFVGEQANAVDKGIILAPGGVAIWSMDSGYRPPNLEVNAYCSAGTPVLAIYEEIITEGV